MQLGVKNICELESLYSVTDIIRQLINLLYYQNINLDETNRLEISFSIQSTVESLLSEQKPQGILRLYSTFTIIELLKTIVKLRKWQQSYKCSIYISESNSYATQDAKEEETAEEFQNKWAQLRFDPPADFKTAIQEQLAELKPNNLVKFNLGYYDAVGDKKTPLLTTLPIPEQFKVERQKKGNQIRLQIGEILFLIRPLVHCILILVYGGYSYKPYFGSLFIDILLYILQWELMLFKKCQKEELKIRMKEAILCYILRNPFYNNVIKQQVLLRILGLFLKQDGWISKLIIQIIEVRSSKSLLI